jgi:hypothetical protein
MVAIGAIEAMGVIDDIGEAIGAALATGCAVAASAEPPVTNAPTRMRPTNQRFMKSSSLYLLGNLILAWKSDSRCGSYPGGREL